MVGTWMQQIALGWMAYRIGGSAWALAWIAVATQAPILALGPWAGALSDRMDRRALVIATQTLFLLQAVALAFLAFSNAAQLWHLGVLALLTGAINAFDTPARQAYASGLIEDRRDFLNAIALNSMMNQGARIVGPAMAAAALTMAGEAACFTLNALSYLAVIAALWSLPADPPEPVGQAGRSSVGKMFAEGWRGAMSDPWIKMALGAAALMSFFGSPYATFLPMVAKESFGGGPALYGVMIAWGAAGALIGGVLLGARGSKGSIGSLIAWSAPLAGASLVGFSFSSSPVAGCVWLFLVSASLLTTALACSALIQSRVEERIRGRVMGILAMAMMGLAPIGSLALSPLASRFGPMAAIGFAGVCLAISGAFVIRRALLLKAAGIDDRQSAGPQAAPILAPVLEQRRLSLKEGEPFEEAGRANEKAGCA